MNPEPPLSESALPPLLEKEFEAIGAEGADRLLNVIRGLFHCVSDLNQRVAHLETQIRQQAADRS